MDETSSEFALELLMDEILQCMFVIVERGEEGEREGKKVNV